MHACPKLRCPASAPWISREDLPWDVARIALPYGRIQHKRCVVSHRHASFAQTRLVCISHACLCGALPHMQPGPAWRFVPHSKEPAAHKPMSRFDSSQSVAMGVDIYRPKNMSGNPELRDFEGFRKIFASSMVAKRST